MSDTHIYPVSSAMQDRAFVNEEQYRAMYRRSIEDPEGFWAEQADIFLSWDRKWDQVFHQDMAAGKVSWFDGGRLNISYNCIDRHLPERAGQAAIIWEGDEPSDNHTNSFTMPCAGWPMASSSAAWARATGYASTCP